HPMTVHRLGFERTFDGNTDDITKFLVSEDSATNSTTSFNAVHSARDFVSAGFSTVNPDSTTVVFGPDADVLLADAFASGYCFRVAPPSRARPTQIGLAFAPPYRQPGRVDIDGILWLDTLARSLRDIEFKYVGLPAGNDGYRPGGSISFHTMANGVSFIDRWYLRRVDALQDTLPDFTFRSFLYATENGGELAHAKWPDGQSWNASLGTLHIRAAWSTGKPAVGATVLLPGTPYRGTADSSGSILIGDLLPGPYSVRINDKHTEQLGFTLPTKLRFIAARDSVHQATLSVPTTEEYVAGLCQKSKQWGYDDSTFVLGRVVNSAGKAVADVRVTFAYWSTALNSWFFTKWYYTTGTDGVFELCSTLFTPGTKLLVRTSRDGRHEDTVRDVSSNLTIVLVSKKSAP
ncbi:MAG: carboxypeptidase-like regulatory domain-containing protein, partial [Gemmatimonadaceae bacterium]